MFLTVCSDTVLAAVSPLEFLIGLTLFLDDFCTTFTVAVTFGLVVDNLLLTGLGFAGDSSDSDEYIAAPFLTFDLTIGFFSSGFFAFTLFVTGLPLLTEDLSFSGPDLLLLFWEEELPSVSEEEESLPDELDEDEDEFELLVEVVSELLALCC